MRVLLINPFYPISETPSPPLGLAALSGALEQKGAETRILDFVVTPDVPGRLELELSRFQPQLVGLTAVTMTFDHAARLARRVRLELPEARIVMGGPHVSFTARETLEFVPSVDIIVVGEGEETLCEIAHKLSDGQSLEKTAGIVFRENGRIVGTPDRLPARDINNFPPPARNRIPLGRYKALNLPISLTTSRGCPFKCIFCVGRKMVGPLVRYRNPSKVVEELAELSALGFHQINIADDLFTSDPSHCEAICDGILERGLAIRWSAFSRVDRLTRRMLDKLSRAGCRAISFGVESANRKILKTVKKGITPEMVNRAVRLCLETGIEPHASFIIGLPGETPQTLEETMAFAEHLKELGAGCGFHVLAPFPGTEVRDQCLDYGIRILTNDWSRYHANRAVAETEAVRKALLDRIVDDWERRYLEYLGDIDQRRKIGKADPEEVETLSNLEHTVCIYDLMMNGALESIGPVSPLPSVDEELKRLSKLSYQAVGHPEETVFKALDKALNDGHLISSAENGGIRWKWVDYL